jgi:hypothetical protein
MRLAAAIVFCLAILAPPAFAQEEPTRCDALPAAVAKTRDAIHAAAAKGDVDSLVALAEHDQATTSFGDVEDLGAYWRSLMAEGTDIPGIVRALLEMPCSVASGEEGTSYGWPSAADLPYADLTDAEKGALQTLYDGHLEDQYLEGPEVGYYVGWRLYIDEDGRWTAFVAGD